MQCSLASRVGLHNISSANCVTVLVSELLISQKDATYTECLNNHSVSDWVASDGSR